MQGKLVGKMKGGGEEEEGVQEEGVQEEGVGEEGRQ